MRNSEMARLGEVPFGRYYGSVDATPLFVMLAGEYYDRTGDRAFLAHSVAARRARARLDRQLRRSRRRRVRRVRAPLGRPGLVQQGWKDSQDSIFHADGTLRRGADRAVRGAGVRLRRAPPRRAHGRRARRPGARDAAAAASRGAAVRVRGALLVRGRIGTYAIALDGRKAPCRVRSSNAGHCLFGGIAAPERARRVAEQLRRPEMFSGLGHPHDRVAARRATTRCPTTTGRYGRTTTVWSPPGSRDTDSTIWLRPPCRPVRRERARSTVIGCPSSFADSNGGPAKGRRCIRSPVRRRRGRPASCFI